MGYRTAEMYPEMVEKVVIVSSAVGATEEQKWEHLGKLGRDVREILCPETPEHFRSLANLTIHKYNVGKWAPDFFLREFITVSCAKLLKNLYNYFGIRVFCFFDFFYYIINQNFIIFMCVLTKGF